MKVLQAKIKNISYKIFQLKIFQKLRGEAESILESRHSGRYSFLGTEYTDTEDSGSEADEREKFQVREYLIFNILNI